MIVHIASDHAGLALKNAVKAHLLGQGLEILDHGTNSAESTDYSLYAHALCKAVLAGGEAHRGILVCGTGLGMSMAANRHRGIRAAVCTCEFHARATREHNNANVICLGERVVGEGLALDLVDVFLRTDFAGGRHERRVHLIENEQD